jgi:hypothetical protein
MKVTSLLGSLAPTIISSILEALFGAFHPGLTKATCDMFPGDYGILSTKCDRLFVRSSDINNNKAFLASFTEAA